MTTMATRSRLPQATDGRVAAPAKRLGLKDSIKGSRRLPARLSVHGPGGIGKTLFACHAPNPYCLLSKGETGLHTLMDQGLLPNDIPNIEIQAWPDVLSVLDDLAKEDHDRKTLVIDVLDGLEKICHEWVCQTMFGGDMGHKGFMNYQNGYKVTAQGPWRELLMALDKIREQRQMRVILLCHSVLVKGPNAWGPDYLRYAPNIHKDAWQITHDWVDIVLFAYREVYAEQERGESRGKAKGAAGRMLLTEWSPLADAKNRHDLPAEISMGDSGKEAWNNFIAAVAAAKKEAK